MPHPFPTTARFSPPRIVGVLVVAVASASALGSAQTRLGPQRDAAPARTGVLKSWDDTIKQGGRDVARHVNIVFDYRAGIAWEYAYDEAGRPLSSRRLTANLPRPTPEEIAEAVEIIRGDLVVGRIMSRANARPEGGFLLEEESGQACGPRTRCVQLLLMAEHSAGLLRRVVVDLTKRRLAYASYVPNDGQAGRQ
jgi:hypothetical protein